MKYKLPAILLVVLVAVLLWRVASHGPKPAVESGSENPSSQVEATRAPLTLTPSEPVTAEETPGVVADTPVSSSTGSVPAKTGRAETVPGELEHAARTASLETTVEPEMSGLSPAIVLENMRSVFRQYSSRFGGNPVGTNPEITAALNGKNPRQVVFLDSEAGARINGRGELVDNWGTPYFFHQLSGTQIEIHSAGPDRKMWTRDDLVMK